MERSAYRGVSFNEAKRVIHNQHYDRNELKTFANGVVARSLFGPGVYLINDIELAAQYAFCHAEVENEEKAVVLRQKIHFSNPFILNYQFSESRLRKEAMRWKFTGRQFPTRHEAADQVELSKQISNGIRDYLLYRSNDGIVYHIDDEIIYYVLYDQEKQLKEIDIELVFEINR